MTDQETQWNRLIEAATEAMERSRVPGLALGILHDDEIRTAGIGVTNVNHPLPVTGETLFQIGSITKTFVGTVIMRLVEQGKLDLDATVQTYVPDFRVLDESVSTGVTIRQLLTHMSGWAGDFFRDTGGGDDALSRYVADMADLPQLAPPDCQWSYNNAGFSLAGHIIEQVTCQSFQSVLSEFVLQPLGLEHTYIEPADVMVHRFAVGHHVSNESVEVAEPWPLPRCLYPAGGIVCDAGDLLRYARFHLGDGMTHNGDRVLMSESMTQMQTPQVTVWGDESWGLSWEINDAGGFRQVMHGGGTVGQISRLTLVPAQQFALVVLTNADAGGAVTERISRWILKEYLGLETPRPVPVDASEAELAAYCGHYERPFADVDVGMLGGRLIGQVADKAGFPAEDAEPGPPSPPMALALCEQDRLLVLDGPLKDATFDVIRKADGSIGWLRAQSRLHVRQE